MPLQFEKYFLQIKSYTEILKKQKKKKHYNSVTPYWNYTQLYI